MHLSLVIALASAFAQSSTLSLLLELVATGLKSKCAAYMTLSPLLLLDESMPELGADDGADSMAMILVLLCNTCGPRDNLNSQHSEHTDRVPKVPFASRQLHCFHRFVTLCTPRQNGGRSLQPRTSVAYFGPNNLSQSRLRTC